MITIKKLTLVCYLISFGINPIIAQEYMFDEEDIQDNFKDASYSPFVGENFPKNVYWGDTHLHTSNSYDAGFINWRVGVEEAYRFASGEEINANNGMVVKLVRPLDWLVVSDHAEYLGIIPGLRRADPLLQQSEEGRRWSAALQSGDVELIYKSAMELLATVAKREPAFEFEEFTQNVWQDAAETADRMNQPGFFTAFTGFEWTSQPYGACLNRVVIFGDDADKVTRVLPFSAFDSEDPEDLWNYMAAYQKKTGGSVLALAHNGNISNGEMFPLKRFNGEPLTKAYAKKRMRWEPLYEVTQIKGDGETHPAFSPNDEFANYGTWDNSSIVGSEPKKPGILEYEYARSVLRLGLKLGKELGRNPFKFGLVGSTDSHTGLATAKEENFFGIASHLEPDNINRAADTIIKSTVSGDLTSFGWEQVAGGLAAVWATENTREGILSAMKRKETYATTGSRMTVRFFGGWNFTEADIQAPRPVKEGYNRGVPMGGDLHYAIEGMAASFLVWALRDPDGANLDRIQIVKGWLDEDGELHEKVYDVVVSDDRKIGSDGRCDKPVGNTVNVEEATYTNSIGAPLLAASWVDPDFDLKEHAFYYVRVLEIPTPRWTAYDSKRLGSKLPEGDPGYHQERAYTSPIWYTP